MYQIFQATTVPPFVCDDVQPRTPKAPVTVVEPIKTIHVNEEKEKAKCELFKQNYLKNFDQTPLALYILNEFYRGYIPLNRFIKTKSNDAYDVALDMELMTDLSQFLGIYHRTPFTKENAEIILSRYFQDKKQEYNAMLTQILHTKRIQKEKLWQKNLANPLSSRNEAPVKENALGIFTFDRPKDRYREDYLKATGVVSHNKPVSAFVLRNPWHSKPVL